MKNKYFFSKITYILLIFKNKKWKVNLSITYIRIEHFYTTTMGIRILECDGDWDVHGIVIFKNFVISTFSLIILGN